MLLKIIDPWGPRLCIHQRARLSHPRLWFVGQSFRCGTTGNLLELPAVLSTTVPGPSWVGAHLGGCLLRRPGCWGWTGERVIKTKLNLIGLRNLLQFEFVRRKVMKTEGQFFVQLRILTSAICNSVRLIVDQTTSLDYQSSETSTLQSSQSTSYVVARSTSQLAALICCYQLVGRSYGYRMKMILLYSNIKAFQCTALLAAHQFIAHLDLLDYHPQIHILYLYDSSVPANQNLFPLCTTDFLEWIY